MSTSQLKALVIAFDGIEEVEALTPVDILRRAEVKVTIASVTGQKTVTGRNQITFSVDAFLADLKSEDFDLIVLPGGPGVLELLDEPLLAEILKKQDQAKRPLAAICAAPKLLAHHRILDGHAATSHSSVRTELPQPSNDRVVEDAHLTTSQGAGTAVEFSLALVKRLCGEAAAREIAASIHS